MGRVLALLALAVAGTALAAGPVPLGPCGPIDRAYDPVEVRGADLHLGPTPTARLGVVAIADGRPHAIPFQVDEKRGRKLALPEGREPLVDDKPDVLDADDLVVFMACDAGARADAAEATLGPVTAWR